MLLANGGRVRGVVVDDDPQKGITIKLGDGSVRKLKKAEIQKVVYGSDARAPSTPAPTAPAPIATTGVLPTRPPPTSYGAYDPHGDATRYAGPRLERRSTGLMVTGIVFLGLGAHAVAAGVSLGVASEWRGDMRDAAMGLAIGGGSLMFLGLLFTPVGAEKVMRFRDDASERGVHVAPAVGPRWAGLTGTF